MTTPALMLFDTPVQELTFHFIGVGGIGMSGLADVLARAGATVSGSDSGTKGDFTRLEAAGVKVYRGHNAAQLPAPGPHVHVVTSTAIPATNPELATAKAQGYALHHRAAVLGAIMQNFRTVAVSGTHGKTSTTALIYTVLKAAGLSCGVINGGVLEALGTNAVLPPHRDDWLVVEADESDASFLELHPTVAVITNIEAEHMATYGSEAKLMEAFEQFANRAELAVLCLDDPNTALLESRLTTDVLTYGQDDTADSVVREFHPQGRGMVMDVSLRGAGLDDVAISLPGVHYVLNSLAALTVAQALSADILKGAAALATFQGVGRRFTRVGTFNGAEVIDDYGHHPTEIATTLEAAKQVYPGRVIAVIQPHRYSRLQDLMDEFATSAKVADVAVLLPVYAAGEAPLAGVNSDVLGEKMDATGFPEEIFVTNGEAQLQHVLKTLNLQAGDAIVCLGAGDISAMAHRLVTAGAA